MPITLASEVIVRPANHQDFEWVAELMDRALSPFYGGDHRAHARRIFDTHINGGVDSVGHFSSGQHMFVAEVGGSPAGLLHVVSKRQETVKISPLIVDPAFRGVRGVGSRLLAHAEQFARASGARQLYCTVAGTNKGALEFFQQKGFRVTGTASGHYMAGVNEHMLYKQLIEDTGISAPNVSVVPFVEEIHGASVREMIMAQMTNNFVGVDDEWVDALFAGYRRRDTRDVNEKFKVIFVAESAGEVVGVAGATPKKGDPIKLMPLVATTEAAFEALIIDLQGLLAEYGHKLYVHLVPEAWQVACLQRHGWKLEGVFPGGYAPDSIVHQWGYNLNGEAKVKVMRIKRPYYDAIMEERKTFEVRVGYDGIKRFKPGEHVKLETAQVASEVVIGAIRVYDDFVSMLAVEPWERIAPDVADEAAVLRLLRGIYPAHKEALGVYVFEVKPIKKS